MSKPPIQRKVEGGLNETYYLCDRFKIHVKWIARNILKR